jgi:VIT1/CCC1 family predicted Fe2+/Mn2+ transporter
VIVIVSYILAFLSGMNVARRIAMNLIIIAVAVSVTYTIGTVVKNVFGVAI